MEGDLVKEDFRLYNLMLWKTVLLATNKSGTQPFDSSKAALTINSNKTRLCCAKCSALLSGSAGCIGATLTRINPYVALSNPNLTK